VADAHGMAVRARALRKSQTEAERALWRELRRKQLDGAKFRRQEPIGALVADFVCFERGLIVELDGGHHNEEAQFSRDSARTAWLESQGFTVLRFWNNDVLGNIEGVMETIKTALFSPSPLPSPIEGEGITGTTGWRGGV